MNHYYVLETTKDERHWRAFNRLQKNNNEEVIDVEIFDDLA